MNVARHRAGKPSLSLTGDDAVLTLISERDIRARATPMAPTTAFPVETLLKCAFARAEIMKVDYRRFTVCAQFRCGQKS